MRLLTLGIILIFIGFSLIVLSSLLLGSQFITTGGNVQYSGVILIGPLPIFFGSAPSGEISSLVTFGIVLTIIAVILYIISLLLLRRHPQRW